MGFMMCINFIIKPSNLISNQTSEIPDVIIHSNSEESNRNSSDRRRIYVSCRRDHDHNNEDENSSAPQSINFSNLHYTHDNETRHLSGSFNVRWVANPLYDSIQIIPHTNSIITVDNTAVDLDNLISPYAISDPLY